MYAAHERRDVGGVVGIRRGGELLAAAEPLPAREHGGVASETPRRVGEVAVQLVVRAAAQQPLDTRVHSVLQLAQVVRWREEGLRQLRHYQKK